MPNDRDWLRAERRSQDALAEALFARLVAEMPPIEPGADFVRRTVQAAWRARARRRRVMRLAGVAAALLLGITSFFALYGLSAWAGHLIVRGAVAFADGLVWFVTSVGEGARWWWIAERIGSAVSISVTTPATAAAVAGAGMTVLLAMYAFRHLVRDEFGTRESRKVQI